MINGVLRVIIFVKRYLMYINGENKTYLLDRDNSVFIAKSLKFLQRKDLSQHLNSTLLDGVKLKNYLYLLSVIQSNHIF
jgi:hypothetical protein